MRPCAIWIEETSNSSDITVLDCATWRPMLGCPEFARRLFPVIAKTGLETELVAAQKRVALRARWAKRSNPLMVAQLPVKPTTRY